MPDDLFAQQIIIDAITSVMSDRSKFNIETEQFNEGQFAVMVFKAVHQLAKKRFLQKNKHEEMSNLQKKYSPFYSLPLEERTVLYLIMKSGLDHWQIEEVLELDKLQLMEKFHLAQDKLSELTGISPTLQEETFEFE